MPATYDYRPIQVTDRTALVAGARVRDTSAWGLAARGAAALPPAVRERDESTQRAAARAALGGAAPVSSFAGCPVVPDLLNRHLPAAALTPTFTIGGVEYNALTKAADLMRLSDDAAAAQAAAAGPAAGVITPAEALAEARAALVAVPARLLAGAGLREATAGVLRGLGLLLAIVAGAGLLADLLL